MIKLNRRQGLAGSYAGYSGNNKQILGALGKRNNNNTASNTDPSNKQDTNQDGSQFISESSLMPVPFTNGSMSTLPITVDLGTLLDDIGHDYLNLTNDKQLYRLYRDMYYFDPVAGAAVDMISGLPFSEFSLGGITDKDVNKVFNHTLERLNVRTLLPEMSVDYLVLGAFIASLLYDKNSKTFSDIMPHAIENTEIISLPFYSQAPIIEVKFSEALIKLLSNTKSPRIQALRDKFGAEIIGKIQSGKLELDPLSTVYLPRRSFSHTEGTSYYKRILPIWLLEKNLFRGTLIESSRRQRGIAHITVGDGESFEPTPADMDFITELFVGASADPLGAIVATRLGVSIEEVLCISGNTEVSTSEGLIKIKDIVPHNPNKFKGQRYAVPIDIEVKGLYGDFVKADIWMYQGYKDVYRVKTERGGYVDCTENHRFLILDENTGLLKKVKAKYLLPNNLSIACDTKGYCTTADLPLNLNEYKFKLGNKVFTKPEIMTPELAYVLGIVLSDGVVSDRNKGTGHITVSNTSLEILKHFQHCMLKVFGETGNILVSQLASTAPKNRYLNGRKVNHNHDGYYCSVYGDQLVQWFKQLGMMSSQHGTSMGTRACLHYVVPSIMFLANRESRLAFIAGVIDGDGHVAVERKSSLNVVGITICSGSPDLLQGLKVMLADIGYSTKVMNSNTALYINPSDACALYNELYKYLQSPAKKPFAVCDLPKSIKATIPSKFVVDVIKSRFVRKGGAGHGSWYQDDDGNLIELSRVADTFHSFSVSGTAFLHQAYENGSYDNVLALLKQISLSTYNKLIMLFNLKLRFEKVVGYDYIGKDHVYDLSVKQPNYPTVFKDGKAYRQKLCTEKKYQPTFYAINGGIHSSNSPTDRWSILDTWDQTTQMKFKALGVNESLLSGDASYNTMDNSLTLFIDHLRAYRDMITRKLFYNTVFPLISVINGYTVNSKGKVSVGESLLQKNLEDTLAIIQDGSKLLIPTVHWSKQLKPEGDSNYFDILDRLTAAGVPVPLRVIAAAGGFNIHELLAQKDDDIANREQIGEYVKQLRETQAKFAASQGQGGQEQGEQGEFSGFSASDPEYNMLRSLASDSNGISPSKFKSAVLASGKTRPSLQDRFKNIDPEIIGHTRTGKPKAIYNQTKAQTHANEMIVKAVRSHVKHGSSQLTNDTETSLKLGG